MPKKSEAKGEKRPWRENIEALVMAIVVALLFKYFILEISKIPSGSMQPTLMGDPRAQVFDRVLVDKLSMRFRDPLRWEIVVFKHPIERSRIMVKRLVGMPGEEFHIEKGDLWTRQDDSQDWTVLRPPASVQEELWRKLDFDKPERSSWSVVAGGEGWRVEGRDVRADGPGKIRFREASGGVRDDYHDGYPEPLRPKAERRGVHAVGDLRVSGVLEARRGLQELTIELTEGRRIYTFHLPGAGGAQRAAWIEVKGPQGLDRRVEASSAWTAEPGRAVRFRVQNLNDELRLELDGDPVCRLDIPAAADQTAFVTLAVTGEGAELSDLMVERDLYYLPDPDRSVTSWTWRIPEGEYLMLGDNTQDSADSRDWKAKRMFRRADRAQESPLTDRGNFRPGENPLENAVGPQGEPLYRFLDEWGEVHWLAKNEVLPGLEFRAPTVPRHLIVGRAVSVFWPIKPHRGLWRLKWLH